MVRSLRVFSAYGPTGGSARVRLFDWLAHTGLPAQAETYLGTSKLGLKRVLRQPFGTVAAEVRLRMLARATFSGTTVLSRRASPFSTGQVEARLMTRSQHSVYDFDDALYLDDQRRMGSAAVWRSAVRHADVVIAGNAVLASAADGLARRTVLIPSCVEPSDYVPKTSYELSTVPTAVWIGTPSTEKYLLAVAPAFLRAYRRYGLRLRVVSAGAASLGELDVMVERRPWQAATFAADLAAGDFGVMPLVDDPWARGKCAYKLLQYGAAALPMIGSPVGVNGEILAGAGGWAPRDVDEWSQALEAVLSAPASERCAAGTRGCDLVSREYSYARWAPTWLDAVGAARTSSGR